MHTHAERRRLRVRAFTRQAASTRALEVSTSRVEPLTLANRGNGVRWRRVLAWRRRGCCRTGGAGLGAASVRPTLACSRRHGSPSGASHLGPFFRATSRLGPRLQGRSGRLTLVAAGSPVNDEGKVGDATMTWRRPPWRSRGHRQPADRDGAEQSARAVLDAARCRNHRRVACRSDLRRDLREAPCDHPSATGVSVVPYRAAHRAHERGGLGCGDDPSATSRPAGATRCRGGRRGWAAGSWAASGCFATRSGAGTTVTFPTSAKRSPVLWSSPRALIKWNGSWTCCRRFRRRCGTRS